MKCLGLCAHILPESSGRQRRLRAAFVLGLTLLLGCEGAENGGEGLPVVWPQAARLGDSVAWVISSDMLIEPQLAPTPFSTWTRDNVTIGLSDELGYAAPALVPRAVFEAQSAAGARIRGMNHRVSAGALIAVFDLPPAWPNPANPLPSSLELALFVEGQKVDPWSNAIEILGDAGSPTVFGTWSPVELLEPGPMLRLRPHWESTSQLGMDPAWVIAGIEFILTFPVLPNGGITQPRAVPAGDAATALSLTGPVTVQGGMNRVRINVLLPDGFRLLGQECDPSGCYSGRTSLIDIAFTKSSGTLPTGTPVFEADNFGIEALKIVDPNGVQLNATPGAADYFSFFVVGNLSEGS